MSLTEEIEDAPTPPAESAPATPGEVSRGRPEVIQPVTLQDLADIVVPLITRHFDGEERKEKREIEFEKRRLEESAKRHRIHVGVGTMLVGGMMVLVGILFVRGQDVLATDLLKTMIAIAFTGIGAYAAGKDRGRKEESGDE